MLLTIGIPTYNRAKELDYNLSLITKSIIDNDLSDKVCILIADNASTDDTQSVIEKYQKKGEVDIASYVHESNKGIEYNTLFVVREAKTPYVMTLGDDDYLEPEYIPYCLSKIQEKPNLGLIIPNKCNIDSETKEILYIKDSQLRELFYSAGYEACLRNSYLGHQLSGIVFVRDEKIINSYKEKQLHNFYPTIYLSAAIALKYDVLFTGKIYVQVSDVCDYNKDWIRDLVNGDLATQAFQNYKALNISHKQRAKLEGYLVKKLPFVILNYKGKERNKVIESIFFGKNTSFWGSIRIMREISYMGVYNGWKLRLLFEFYVRAILLIRLFTGKPIGIY